MRTQYYTATSLDGFLATEDDSLDWLFPLGDLGASSYPAFSAEVGALAMGSATYAWIVGNGERVAQEAGSAWPYAQPAWVFTRRQPLFPRRLLSPLLRLVSVQRGHDPFVLVHGSSGGSWVWTLLAPLLRAAGHDIYAPTLTGLADRAHLLDCSIDLTTHVTDIAHRRHRSRPGGVDRGAHDATPGRDLQRARRVRERSESGPAACVRRLHGEPADHTGRVRTVGIEGESRGVGRPRVGCWPPRHAHGAGRTRRAPGPNRIARRTQRCTPVTAALHHARGDRGAGASGRDGGRRWRVARVLR